MKNIVSKHLARASKRMITTAMLIWFAKKRDVENVDYP